jgi:hypothetical protein
MRKLITARIGLSRTARITGPLLERIRVAIENADDVIGGVEVVGKKIPVTLDERITENEEKRLDAITELKQLRKEVREADKNTGFIP